MNTALAVCHRCGWAEDAATRAWHEQLAERLASLTPPSRKNEFWRYSRLSACFAPERAGRGLDFPFPSPEPLAGEWIYFDQGRPVAAHTRAWRLRPWSELDEATRARWRERLEPGEDYFSVRNLVEADAVLLLELEETADAPLQIRYRHGAGWAQPLLLVEVAAGARGAIVETFASFGPSTKNGAVTLWLGEGAELTHGVFTADEGEALLHRVRAELGARARLDVQAFASARSYQRLEWDVTLGESSALRLSGITYGAPPGSTDVALRIRHAAPGAATDVRWRGLVPAEAHSAVIGRILIEPAGQRTDAAMRLDHLLLADGAAADVKPELEIYADDVACGHGATLGRLDDEALFYLRSRGIPEVEARQLLIDAFLAPVLQRFTLAEVLRHVQSRLPLPDDAAA